MRGKHTLIRHIILRTVGIWEAVLRLKGGLVDVCNASLNERTDLFVKHLAAVKGKHHKRLLKIMRR